MRDNTLTDQSGNQQGFNSTGDQNVTINNVYNIYNPIPLNIFTAVRKKSLEIEIQNSLNELGKEQDKLEARLDGEITECKLSILDDFGLELEKQQIKLKAAISKEELDTVEQNVRKYHEIYTKYTPKCN